METQLAAPFKPIRPDTKLPVLCRASESTPYKESARYGFEGQYFLITAVEWHLTIAVVKAINPTGTSVKMVENLVHDAIPMFEIVGIEDDEEKVP